MTTFAGVIGHSSVTAMLERELERPAHAYLFLGPGNVGKATVARAFAAALVASDDDARRRARRGIHPDVITVEPDGKTALTVDRARETMTHAALMPVEGHRKVFIIEEAGLMNDEAANAMLKTIEEPSRSTVFILCVESEDDVPATIVSRCRVIHFGRVPDPDLVAGLEAAGVDEEQARGVVAAAGGRPGLALDLATRQEVAAFRSWWLAAPLRLGTHPADRYILADEAVAATEPLLDGIRHRHRAELAAVGEESTQMKDRHERELRRAAQALHISGLEMMASFYRDVAAAQLGGPVRNRDVPPSSLTSVGPAAALKSAERVLDAVDALRENQRPHLAFAALFDDLALTS